ncbi:MAG TPA: PQQ-binding-like beta-propeller repeat protein, partial [Micropepsaceae bacterium]|nr:PQQ-binding-like beta-propeller repeat protein [Micropepsaceae bacterium]
MQRLKTALLGLGVTAAITGLPFAMAQTQNNNAVYTAEQATIGQTTFQTVCAKCHQADLRGGFEAPPLIGVPFMTAWRGRSTNELYNKIATSMPADNPRSLSDQAVESLVAFILRSNGAPAGATPLTVATAVPIGQVATGAAAPPAQVQTAAAAPAAPPRAPARLTLQGNIQNYTPVTTQMLLNPSPDDWLMARGGYRGWSHSRLNQINRQNANQLELAWVWAMNDGTGANEPTPLVHNGIMYLVNVDNIVQALDAKTGELLWENRIRPQGARAGGTGAMRNLAIYQDKVYVASTDAHLMALDARTGKTVWDTVLGNSAKGFGNSSGPLIIKGVVVQGLGGCERYKADPKDQGCYISGI